ncbi:LigA protein, partial [Streptomyces sp. NRRL S-444]
MNTDETTYAARPSAPGPGTWRRVLQAAAVAATVPYLCLKGAWLAGSHIGIPDGSVLLGPGMFFKAANAVTLVMDAAVIVLVLVFTRPWGRRVPAWLLTLPVFVATGLLVPIVVAFPGQLLVRAVGLGPDAAAQAAREPFLDPWVFNVVYGGFIVQAIALAALFVPYARERWGCLLYT